MPLQPTVQVVINEKSSCDALHVQLQRRRRGFNSHRSEEGALQLHWAQSSARLPQVLHLCSHSDSTGPLWLWPSWEQDYHDHSLNLLTGSAALPERYANALTHTLTAEKDPSQWLSVFREKNRKTGYGEDKKKKKNRKASLHLSDLFPEQYGRFWNSYLVVSHTDIRTNCVVNNTRLISILALNRTINII